MILLELCFKAFILFFVLEAELPWVWVEAGWLLVSLVLYLHYRDTSLGLLHHGRSSISVNSGCLMWLSCSLGSFKLKVSNNVSNLMVMLTCILMLNLETEGFSFIKVVFWLCMKKYNALREFVWYKCCL